MANLDVVRLFQPGNVFLTMNEQELLPLPRWLERLRFGGFRTK